MNNMKQESNLKPRIYDFTDFRVYLKAIYEHNKSEHNFSYAAFAERAGLKARSFLRTVITGKRNLTPDAISKFIVGLSLEFNEAEAFKALVHYNQASDFKARQHYWETFLKLRPNSERRHRVKDEYLYLARMAYPILLILLRQPHTNKAKSALASMTGLKMSEVEDGLQTLTELGAISVSHDGQITVNSDGFVTTNDTPSIARQTFHTNMLDKAKECLNLDPSEREFQSMMIPLTKEEFLYLKERIRALVSEVDEKFGGRRPKSERAYALNINLIPITPEFIRSEQKAASQKPGDVSKNPEVLL